MPSQYTESGRLIFMNVSKKVCFVTGSRADFGLQVWPIRALAGTPGFEVSIGVTGMHLSPAFGMTVSDVEALGVAISARVPCLLETGDNDTPAAMAAAVARGLDGFAKAWSEDRPDLVVVFGDRFESFAAAEAAFILRIPLAHFYGGDITEGAIDDGFRHGISHMADLHFPSNEEAATRLRNMGINAPAIHMIGSPALDHITRTELFGKADFEAFLGFQLRRRNWLITFHPVTRGQPTTLDQLQALLAALDRLDSDNGLIFTGANADDEGRAINEAVIKFADAHDNAIFKTSLGQKGYLSALSLIDGVVGNSSSGLYEAPSFKIASINIGTRQDGRLKASSVIDCDPTAESIWAAFDQAAMQENTAVINPYGDGQSSEKFARILSAWSTGGGC